MARKKTKRRRVRLNRGPVLALLLVCNVLLGVWLSPITAIRKVRVDGAEAWDQGRLNQILAKLKGVPCALINRNRVESEVMAQPEVGSARFDRSPFGSAVLQVAYRNPVARIYNRNNLGLTIEGVVYQSEHLPKELPTVQLAEGRPQPLLTVSGDWPAHQIALLAAHAREISADQPIRIDFGVGSSLTLNIGGGKAILGSCDNLNAKLDALRDRLKTDAQYLDKIESLNLVDPTKPMVVKKKLRE